jgi:hypothetical protein
MWDMDYASVFAAMDDMLPTNEERAEKAYKAVFGFSYETPPDPEGYDSLNEDIIDLLTALMHLCARKKLDFTWLFETSERHFQVESKAEIIKKKYRQ